MNNNITSEIKTVETPNCRPGDNYPKLQEAIQDQFEMIPSATPLFTTGVDNLFQIFLDNIPEEARNHYTCTACRRFVNNYGGLVTIAETGEIASVMWDEETVPDFFKGAVAAIKKAVMKSEVTGVFLTESRTLGQPETGEWTHMHVELSPLSVHVRRKLTAGQEMAQKLQDHETLKNALNFYPAQVAERGAQIMQVAGFNGDEKVVERSIWFDDIHQRLSGVLNTRHKDNIIWNAVAKAPAGWVGVKGSMLGTLLDDVAAGHDINVIQRKFEGKMHPLKYQRTQAGASAGQIKQAEKYFADNPEMKKSLERRYARIDELETVWKPKAAASAEKKETEGALFAHLIPKEESAKRDDIMDITAGRITWRKLAEEVLPRAEKIEYFVRQINAPYAALVTAVHDDAPPIYQWDKPEKRNPFSMYMYHEGTGPSQWGISPGYCNVTGITLRPSHWHEEMSHHANIVIFILEGAKDIGYEHIGNALFPSSLISELHEFRATIEEYSKTARLAGYAESSACGIAFGEGSTPLDIRVTTGSVRTYYVLDRWS